LKHYINRDYRNNLNNERFNFFNIKYREIDLLIAIDKNSSVEKIKNETFQFVKDLRIKFDNFINQNPIFQKSLKSIGKLESNNKIINYLIKISKKVNMGPMAGIAGAFSEYTGKFLLNNYNISEIIIENGGDIFLNTLKNVHISIFAGKSLLSEKVGLKIKPEETPMGISTSSATVGHSVSFGKADSVTICSKDTVYSDFLATKLCNMVKKDSDIDLVLDIAKKDKKIESAVVIYNNKAGFIGKHEIIKLNKKGENENN